MAAGALVAVIAPWSARNAQVHGAWVPISTHGGFILARSNAFEPDWRKDDGWGITEAFFRRLPTEVERDRYWYAQGTAFIMEHPGYYLRLVGERFVRLWYFFRPDYNLWFMMVMPFSLLGLRQYALRGNYAYLSSFIACSIFVFSTVLYGSTRFRLPLEPLFIAFAAAYLSAVFRRWERQRLLAVLGLVIGGNMLVWWQQEAARGLALSTLNLIHLR